MLHVCDPVDSSHLETIGVEKSLPPSKSVQVGLYRRIADSELCILAVRFRPDSGGCRATGYDPRPPISRLACSHFSHSVRRSDNLGVRTARPT